MKTGINKKCAICKKSFYIFKNRIRIKNYCSRKCYYKGVNKFLTGKNHPNWKKDNVSYIGLHDWIRTTLGSPKECWECGIKDPNKTYDWANISKEYKRSNGIKDWKRVCRSCHRKLDPESIRRGEDNNKTKLTKEQVIKIRKLYRYKDSKYGTYGLAKIFNVGQYCIWTIINRKHWTHI